MLSRPSVDGGSSPALEEETESRFCTDTMGADVSILFLWIVCLEYFTQAFSSVCWTRVYESLREST